MSQITNNPNNYNAYDINNMSGSSEVTATKNEMVDYAYEISALLRGDDGDSKTADIPLLPTPISNADINSIVDGLAGVPSLGATMMAVIVEMSAEQREASKEQTKLTTQAIVSEMNNQADTIREKASTQLGFAIAAGVISIAQGVASMTLAGMSLGKTIQASKAGAGDEVFGQAKMFSDGFSSMSQGINSTGSGISGILSGLGQYYGSMSDAEIKEMDAAIEQLRYNKEMLTAFADSLKELIQKTLSTMDSIQQGQNQTRARILG